MDLRIWEKETHYIRRVIPSLLWHCSHHNKSSKGVCNLFSIELETGYRFKSHTWQLFLLMDSAKYQVHLLYFNRDRPYQSNSSLIDPIFKLYNNVNSTSLIFSFYVCAMPTGVLDRLTV